MLLLLQPEYGSGKFTHQAEPDDDSAGQAVWERGYLK